MLKFYRDLFQNNQQSNLLLVCLEQPITSSDERKYEELQYLNKVLAQLEERYGS